MKPILNNFLLEEKGPVVILTINRPEVRNAMNPDCWRELHAFVNWVDTQDNITSVIITGAGDKAFIAGADLNSVRELDAITAVNPKSMESLKAIASSPKIFIAAVNGYAFGGGCEISIACDLRVASENARFGLPETNLGIIPGAGGTQRLPKIVGLGVAKEMVLAGRVLTGEEAVNYGLAYKCVAQEELLDTAMQVAQDVAAKAPLAVSFAKNSLNQALSVEEETGLMIENQLFAILTSSEDKAEGIASFFEKRKPNFKNR